ncbi:RHS repeat domain-containing protein [Zooshikella ganghwensis]|uniref:RHS repeat domain-containing protein n=1 Tax=Zooshikella ganghwensis TaxID=202772 RepID=UPI00041CD160|nr:RHS repeat protein [Zooshikella ganghwensis]
MIITNAYNYSDFLSGTVDPRTGIYSFQIILGKIIGSFLEGPELEFSIRYSFLSNEDFGFGKGWLSNLSRYNHRLKTLILGYGKSYHVDTYQVGEELNIRYGNSNEFRAHVKPDGRIVISYKSGIKEYLNCYGFLEKIEQLDGRSLIIEYKMPSDRGKIKSISDNKGQSISFTYMAGEVLVEKNTQKQLAVRISDKQLKSVKLSDEEKFIFQYRKINSYYVLKSIIHPSGATESLTYDLEGLRTPEGCLMSTLPAIINHRIYGSDINEQNKRYEYSRHNYLGFSAGAKYVEGRDNLYERSQDYLYTSYEYTENKKISRTYNRFHLLIQEEVTDYHKNITISNREISYLCDPQVPFSQQPPTYSLPVKDKTTYYNQNGDSFSESYTYEYDDYGNITKSTDPFGRTECIDYYLAEGESGCPPSPTNVPIFIKQRVTYPSSKYLDGSEHVVMNCYTYKAYQRYTNDYSYPLLDTEVVKTINNKIILKRKTDYYTADTTNGIHGKIKSETVQVGLRIAKDNYKYTIRNNEITISYIYSINDNKKYQESTVFNLSHGNKVETRDRNGIISQFEYDIFMRPTIERTYVGTSYQSEIVYNYSFGAKEKYIRKTDSVGCIEQYNIDCLGRVICIYKNSIGCRLEKYQSMTYDYLGNVSSVTKYDTDINQDEYQYTTQYEYDIWGNQCKKILPSGLIYETVHDKPNKTKTVYLKSLNGNKVEIEACQFNEDNQEITNKSQGKTSYRKYNGTGLLVEESGTYEGVVRYEYDEIGRVVSETIGDNFTVKKCYDTDSLDEYVTELKVNNVLVGSRSYDYLGRVIVESKYGLPETNYNYKDSWLEPISIKYNNITIQRTLDKSFGKVVHENSNTGDIAIEYQYTLPECELKSVKNSHSQKNLTYYNNGLLKSIQQDGRCLEYVYSRQGNVLKRTDFFGNTEYRLYNTSGYLSEINTGLQKCYFRYNEFDLPSEELIIVSDGERLNHQLYYDSELRFEKKISLLNNTIICQQAFIYDKYSQLVGKSVINETGDKTLEFYVYDNLGRLTEYSAEGVDAARFRDNNEPIKTQQYTYNELGDIKSTTTTYLKDGVLCKDIQEFKYHEDHQGQITSLQYNNSEIINIEYDLNGNLIRDEKGFQYKYNSLNQVSEVLSASGDKLASYRYDGLGNQITCIGHDKPPHHRYFDQQDLINESQGEYVSYSLNGNNGILFRAIDNEGEKQRIDFLVTNHQYSPIYSIQNKTIRKKNYQPFGSHF